MGKRTLTPYHPAFAAAMRVEYRDYIDRLDIRDEFTLNTMPNKIDILIIKKEPSLVLNDAIGSFWKRYNIIEYKSNDEPLDVYTYYRAMAYAYLFLAYHTKDIRIARLSDLSITFYRWNIPKKLIQYFTETGYTVEKYSNGILHITKEGLIPVQIITGRTLGEDYKWLNAVSGEPTLDKINELYSELEFLGGNIQTHAISVLDLMTHKYYGGESKMKDFRELYTLYDNLKGEVANQELILQKKNQEIQEKDQEIQEKDQEISALKKTIEQLKKFGKIAAI
ncbi:MAG: hypothetical protein K6G81_09485 [Lachnospiraceae bacterium]|nr:hypothetical protein [Lachnospiraceae bacterium]